MSGPAAAAAARLSNGYWGGEPSTLDWCEENYALSPYIAEFWNTITNIPLIVLSFYGAKSVLGMRLEKRHFISFFALGVVGLGSWCFHGTLRYDMQLLDELPMIYGTVSFIFALMENDRKPRYGVILPIAMAIACAAFTAAYMYTRNPLFHQACYVSCVFVVLRMSYTALQKYKNKDTSTTLKHAVICIIMAAVFWLCDNHFCTQLQAVRQVVGFPVEGLFQFHGWWHLLTALATYDYIIFSTIVRIITLGKEYNLTYLAGFIPILSLQKNERAK